MTYDADGNMLTLESEDMDIVSGQGPNIGTSTRTLQMERHFLDVILIMTRMIRR